jgi:amidophosphoribosyltransferase
MKPSETGYLEPIGDDKPREACGLFGALGHPDAAKMCYFGLYALQHRGQESAGIAVAEAGVIDEYKGMGLVPDVFDMDILEGLTGSSAVGHVRYSTTGSSVVANAQPLVVRHRNRAYAVAHNGNLVNAHHVKAELEDAGSIFQTTMDSEVFLHLFVRNLQLGFEEALKASVARLKGAFSMVVLTSRGELIGIKDPTDFAPCAWANSTAAGCWHRKPVPWIWCRRSSSANWTRVRLSSSARTGSKASTPIPPSAGRSAFSSSSISPDRTAPFSATTSTLPARPMAGGWQRKPPVDADLVMPFPDSGTYAALGYSETSGIPFETGMIRNHYVGRTFIQPTQSMRDFGVRVKLNPIKELLKGKDIIIIEDSIIRGTTVKTRVKALRELGVKRVHLRVSGPAHRFPCHYGIDFSTKGS